MSAQPISVSKLASYAVFIRAIHERGMAQQEALAELDRRGLWLSDDQRREAGLRRRMMATSGATHGGAHECP